eukprot:697391-Amphidinium_carterae.2
MPPPARWKRIRLRRAVGALSSDFLRSVASTSPRSAKSLRRVTSRATLCLTASPSLWWKAAGVISRML